ncbi:MAG: electron transport complex subunit RsxC, partial [Sedimenticolaceae bacterium]
MSALKDFFSRGFAHGVHPQGFKEHTADLPTQRMPFVGRYVMPLNQHLGAPAIPLVAVGDRVRRGQLIAEPGAFVSTSLHSPVTGRVRAIANRRFPGGVFARSIEIETDPYATQRLEQRPAVDWRDLTKDEFVAQVQHAGIVGMG